MFLYPNKDKCFVMEFECFIKEKKFRFALESLQNEVRKAPSSDRLRLALFHLLCVLGEYKRAIIQLDVLADLNPKYKMFSRCYAALCVCELFRAEVFVGKKTPLMLGEPAERSAALAAALQSADKSVFSRLDFQEFISAKCRVNGKEYAWLCDGDIRTASVLEIYLNEKYYWIDLNKVLKLSVSEPKDLGDLVWIAAELTLKNGGLLNVHLPVRYVSSLAEAGGAVLDASLTEWTSVAEGSATYFGAGQRTFLTDECEFGILEIRELEFIDE